MTRKAFALAVTLAMLPALARVAWAQDGVGGFPLDKTFQVVSVGDLDGATIGIIGYGRIGRSLKVNGGSRRGSCRVSKWCKVAPNA